MENTYGKRVLETVIGIYEAIALGNRVEDCLFDADLAIKSKNQDYNWEVK